MGDANQPSIPERVISAAQRALRSDFSRDHATEYERASLAAGPARVTQSLAQDLAAWRGAVLLISAILMVLATILQVFAFETFSSSYVEAQMQALMLQGQYADEDQILSMLNQQMGEDNVDLLDTIPILGLLASLAVLVFTLLAARSWCDPKRSGWLARAAWIVLVGGPLLLAILPWSRFLDFSHVDASQARVMRSIVGMNLGLSFFLVLAPKLIGIFPGIIRASVTLKTMLHESPVPGYVVALFAPVYAMFVLVVFTTLNQIEGGFTLLLGLAFLVLAPLVYLWRARAFLRPHTAEESVTLVRDVRRQAFLLNAIGVSLVVWFLATIELISIVDVMQFVITAGGGVLLTMVVAADLLLELLRLEHSQAKQFVGTELAAAFDEKLVMLTDPGASPPPLPSSPDL